MDWPTGQEVNRQPRALLTILLIVRHRRYRLVSGGLTGTLTAVIQRHAIAVSDVRRGGRITSSLRSEPRSFNRLVAADFPTDLFTQLTGQARSGQPGDRGAGAVAGRKVEDVADNRPLPDAARRA